jgi:SAM-dependent methyltransferase
VSLINRQAGYLNRGKKIPKDFETHFYDLIADERISGFIHSQKRIYILDVSVLLIALVSCFKIEGEIMDIGCHIGYHPIIVAEDTGKRIYGIDRSVEGIAAANRKKPKSLDITFEAKSLESGFLEESFEMIVSVDSVSPTRYNLNKIASLLKSNGVLVLIDDFPNVDSLKFRNAANAAGLGFGLADVVGGLLGAERHFECKSVLVLLKGYNRPIPKNLREVIETGWELFKPYANQPSTPLDRKTQAYCRAKIMEYPTNSP